MSLRSTLLTEEEAREYLAKLRERMETYKKDHENDN